MDGPIPIYLFVLITGPFWLLFLHAQPWSLHCHKLVQHDLKYAQKPYEGSEVPPVSEMGHSVLGKSSYTTFAIYTI